MDILEHSLQNKDLEVERLRDTLEKSNAEIIKFINQEEVISS